MGCWQVLDDQAHEDGADQTSARQRPGEVSLRRVQQGRNSIRSLATADLDQSGFLAALGQREDALAAIEEAARTYRQLAPAAFLPDLAMSLNNQSLRLSGLGRREDALAAIDEAVAICRQLAAGWPAAFLANLSSGLSNLADVLTTLNREHEAVAARREAANLSNSH